MIVERDGATWVTDSFDKDDLQITKDNELVAEWVKGKYMFKSLTIKEQDLMVIVDLVEKFKEKMNKRI